MKLSKYERFNMKRALLLSIFVILPVLSATAQLLGDGSMANPYRGTLIGDFTISGKKYFSGNIIADNEKLTIAAGATLISTNSKAGILINGTGQFDARGTSSNKILFTADLDLDGINGETTDTWGNITLVSTGTNLMDYCTIENGRRTDAKIGSYGGGLYLGTSTATVTNIVIRNCLAIYGGGIIVAGSSSPVISRCTFTGNTANEQGGAVYVAGGSSPLISNVIFHNNSSLSATRKGGTIASIASSPIIVNSLILYSSSPATDGKSVYLENSSNARIINTIMWGGSAHVGLSGTPSSVIDYCAIEGASFSGCINLNSSNTAPDGPNFVNPGSGDFSITFDSPCRDSGSNSYPGVTIPPGDFINTSRIGVTDIGAYEVIYSRWMGTTNDWTRIIAWDKGFVPGTRNIIIPAGLSKYPTLSPGPSFTLNSGLKMIVESGARVTFSSLTNNGTIYLKANATAMASLMTNSFSGSGGSLNVEVFLKGSTGEEDLWHYIASPVTVPIICSMMRAR
jgi:predicted outer membrane repeat protein